MLRHLKGLFHTPIIHHMLEDISPLKLAAL